MLTIVNYVMGTHCDIPCHVGSAPIMGGAMLEFQKLQIMLLGFGYLELSEKSEKKYTNTIHIGL